LICGAVGTDKSWLSQLLTELLLPDGAGRAFDGRWWIFELSDSTKAVLLGVISININTQCLRHQISLPLI
jgi:hypothetical protein